MNYVYFDEYGFMHGTESESNAKKFSSIGNYQETELPVKGGYIYLDEKEIEARYKDGVLKVYSEKNGDKTHYTAEQYPQVFELIEKIIK